MIAIATGTDSRQELYGITSQVRRRSGINGANVAEGCGTTGNAQFERILGIAAGSASELESHLLLARDVGLLAIEYKRLNSYLK